MKTKSLLICLLAVLPFVQTKAQQLTTYNTAIQYFIDSHITSDAKKLNQVLSDDATYKIPRQSKVTVQSKSALIAAMRKEAGIKQNCSSTSKVLTATDALVVARVDFVYPEFTQQNYLTIEKDDNKNWKISSVCKIFLDDTGSAPAPAATAY